jgi:hypothetical protein
LEKYTLMSPILADMAWPALLLAGRLATWWCIAISVVIEAVALWRFIRWCPHKALFASLTMNTVSAFCGTLLLPVAGLRWEATASLTIYPWFGWGIFGLANQAVTWLIAVILSTAIEAFVLWLVFYAPWTRRLIVVVLAANAITVSLAFLWQFVGN